MTPNVVAAAAPEEVNALHERYEHVEKICAQLWQIILDFQKHVEEMACITINLAFETVNRIVAQHEFYKNYYELYSEGIKKFDRDREITDVCLFGEERGKSIRYGALCSRPSGLHSYGEFCIVLDGAVLQECASLFEENPFIFLKKHPYLPKQEPCIPPGYRATWQNRGKLAVAKLGERITESTQPCDFPDILTHSASDKMEDDFIEVHISKQIIRDDIVEVRAPKKLTFGKVNPQRRAKLAKKDVLRVSKMISKLGKKWTTY